MIRLGRLRPARWRSGTVLMFVAVLAGAGLLQGFGVNPAASQTLTLVAREAASDPGVDPNAEAWNEAPKIEVALTAQPAAYAVGGGSVSLVSAQALHYDGRLFIRLEWDDDTQDDATVRVEDFSDAVALEFPAESTTSVPSICMGQADQGVNIWHWRADSQAGVRAPLDVYPNGYVDAYPDQSEDIWFPARAVGNPFADPSAKPVQDLVARAFRTIGPAASQDVDGKGVRTDSGWAVVLARAFTPGGSDQASFETGAQTDMAIAVWNGSEGDRDGQKSVSQFLTLDISAASLAGKAGAGGADSKWLYMAAGIMVLTVAIGGLLAYVGTRTD